MEEFMQFSDQIRLRTAALSLGPTIWSDDRRNLDTAAATAAAAANSVLGAAADPLPLPNPSWTNQKLAFASATPNRYNNTNSINNTNDKNTAFGSSKPNNGGIGYFNNNNNININNGSSNIKSYFNSKPADGKRNLNYSEGKGSGKKKSGNGNNNDNGGAVDKRFKTLPPAEALPRNEAVGGYIFVCNNDTMQENLRRQLFGLPPRYRDSVRAITPGLPLFLYNYSTHQLHGIFEAASFGGTNIDPTAWEDKKCPGESRFPAQVRVMTRKISEPLEEDSFRPILHHYDGPKFRLELSVPEALALLDIFAENNA